MFFMVACDMVRKIGKYLKRSPLFYIIARFLYDFFNFVVDKCKKSKNSA